MQPPVPTTGAAAFTQPSMKLPGTAKKVVNMALKGAVKPKKKLPAMPVTGAAAMIAAKKLV